MRGTDLKEAVFWKSVTWHMLGKENFQSKEVCMTEIEFKKRQFEWSCF